MRYLIGATPESDLIKGLPAHLLRPGDAIVVQSGGRSAKTIQEALREVRLRFPGIHFYVACGPKRVIDLCELGTKILIDWEQSSWANYTALPWTWNQDDTMSRIKLAAHPTRSSVGLLLTCAPLVNRALLRKGVKWDFGIFAYSFFPCVLQTQGFLKRSPFKRLTDKIRGNTDWELALERLSEQFPYGMSRDIAVEVAMGDTANSVNPQTAYKAVKLAEKAGVEMTYLFGSSLPDVRRLLELDGRGENGTPVQSG